MAASPEAASDVLFERLTVVVPVGDSETPELELVVPDGGGGSTNVGAVDAGDVEEGAVGADDTSIGAESPTEFTASTVKQ